MALTTEDAVIIANRKAANKEKAMKNLGWTAEQYDEWSEEWSKAFDKMTPTERRKYEREQNRESRQLFVLLWLMRATEKTRLPFVYLYPLIKWVL